MLTKQYNPFIGFESLPGVAFRRPVRGVTLMEVIFAMAIILGGLVGLAALIPIAANNVRATIELDRSINESISALAQSRAHEFNDLDRLVFLDKPVLNSSTANGSYAPIGRMATIQGKLDVAGVVDSPGYGHNFGAGLISGICIDPMGVPNLALDSSFVADASVAAPWRPVAAADSAFDASRFPFYSERYGVLVPPNADVDSFFGTVEDFGGGNAGPVTKPWPMSPRMYRVTTVAPTRTIATAAIVPPPVFQHQLIAQRAIDSIFKASGGIVDYPGGEREDPLTLQTSGTVIGAESIDNSVIRASRYSWMITLSPPFLGGNSFRQSIVIMRDRLPPVPRRRGDVVALQKDSYNVNNADENPDSERITWVGNWVGFTGGAGGDVLIHGSNAVSDDVAPGEWVMLSRQPHAVAAGPVFNAVGPVVHRWYKVLRVSEVMRPSATLPASPANWTGGTTEQTWSRWLTLAGPDWAFDDDEGTAPGLQTTTPINDTFCTLVSGAVSVVESEVVLDEQ